MEIYTSLHIDCTVHYEKNDVWYNYSVPIILFGNSFSNCRSSPALVGFGSKPGPYYYFIYRDWLVSSWSSGPAVERAWCRGCSFFVENVENLILKPIYCI